MEGHIFIGPIEIMKRISLALLVFVSSLSLSSQIVINEIVYGTSQAVEIKNLGPSSLDISDYWLCSFPTYNQLSSLTVLSGSLNLDAGALLVVSGHGYSNTDDELGLYTASGFGNEENIIDYVEWGSTGHVRSTVAQAAGIWSAGDFVADIAASASLEYDGTGDSSSDWGLTQSNSQGQENSNVGGECEASLFAVGSQTICEGGAGSFQVVLTGIGPWTFYYTLDGEEQEPVVATETPFTWTVNQPGFYDIHTVADQICEVEANGSLSVTEIAAPTGTISGEASVCANDSAFLEVAFTGQGPWTFTYQIDGAPQGEVTTATNPEIVPVSMAGLYVLTSTSNNSCEGESFGSVDVEYVNVDAGALSYQGTNEAVPVCVDDGMADNLTFDIMGSSGSNGDFLVTDMDGVLIEVVNENGLDFEGQEAGSCLVWHLAYEDFILGLTPGNQMPDSLMGCFSLSNPIEVVKQTGSDCTISIAEEEALSFELFPNPVSEHLNISLRNPSSGPMLISILDMSGRELYARRQVQQLGEELLLIDVSNLAKGSYVILLQPEGATAVQRIFVKA